ncbi:hypothetical protein GGQ74_002693 [Desulfobaculum xiamenense]|uniref:Lipopolysaccharide-assembly n=1 Tax=Desulfobaculum xiamenense TaxID=995050 RepID=A0A846QWK9_9BACT|nr:LPS assembly lipoprotein LptE [Desulfobaculum xiamenense]NJB68999.1 hypothetical protein [Desulfobaculum xiamenense]
MTVLRTILLSAVLALALSGCGYHATGHGEHLVLDASHRALCIRSVENPTLKPWLESVLRAEVRDEFTRRGHIDWASVKDAQADLHLVVNSFRSDASLTDSDDETIKSSSTITLTARIVSRDTGAELWNSGPVSASQSFTTGGKESAEHVVVNLAVRRLADRLTQAY